MSTSQEVVLFDLPSRLKNPAGDYVCWSPNVWKSRVVLNYKKIPYTTQWLKHPEIEPTLSGLGCPRNPPLPEGSKGNRSAYTLPSVQLPDKSVVMDSVKVAAAIEERYPEPSLQLETGMQDKVDAALVQVGLPLLGVLFPRMYRDVHLPEIIPMWRAKREAQFGMTIEELEKTKGGEPAWQAAKPGFEGVAKLLKENKKDAGPFIFGSKVCYGDLLVSALLESCRRIGEDIYERLCEEVEGARELHEACKPWYEPDS